MTDKTNLRISRHLFGGQQISFFLFPCLFQLHWEKFAFLFQQTPKVAEEKRKTQKQVIVVALTKEKKIICWQEDFSEITEQTYDYREVEPMVEYLEFHCFLDSLFHFRVLISPDLYFHIYIFLPNYFLFCSSFKHYLL